MNNSDPLTESILDVVRQIPDPVSRAQVASRLRARLPAIRADAIREARWTLSPREVAKALGVSLQAVERILYARKGRSHLPGASND